MTTSACTTRLLAATLLACALGAIAHAQTQPIDETGLSLSGSAAWIHDGLCGAADGIGNANPPTSGLCAQGTASTVASANGAHTWQCGGSNGGVAVQCTAPWQQRGVCGPATGVDAVLAPTTGLCAQGTAGAVTSVVEAHTWPCSGSNGGMVVQCAAPWIRDGLCGPAAGIGAQTAPTAGLCAAGGASMVTTAGQAHTWQCTGSNGGTAVQCTAPRVRDGAYGAAPGIDSVLAPTTGWSDDEHRRAAV